MTWIKVGRSCRSIVDGYGFRQGRAMHVGDICNRSAVIGGPDTSARAAAGLMRRNHVGDVIVVEERGGRAFPIGIVTDRDLVIEVLEKGLDAEACPLRDVMSAPLIVLDTYESIDHGLLRMQAGGVRRAPVVDERGGLVGVLSADELVRVLSDQIGGLAALLDRQRIRERELRPGTNETSEINETGG